MPKNEVVESRRILRSHGDGRKVCHDYVNITEPRDEDEDDNVFYVNVGSEKSKGHRLNVQQEGAGQFEQYDDDETNNYYEVAGGTLNSNDVTPRYVNVDNRTVRSPKKCKSNYIDLFFPKSPRLSSSKSRSSTSGLPPAKSSSLMVSSAPVLRSSSCDYVRIDTNATTAIHRSISEHRHYEKKHKNKTSKAL